MQLNCLEASLKSRWRTRYPDRTLTIGRVANLTEPHNGRGKCLSRDLCLRGCPYGAYFSSNSATLPGERRQDLGAVSRRDRNRCGIRQPPDARR